jgi:hypothetical protein
MNHKSDILFIDSHPEAEQMNYINLISRRNNPNSRNSSTNNFAFIVEPLLLSEQPITRAHTLHPTPFINFVRCYLDCTHCMIPRTLHSQTLQLRRRLLTFPLTQTVNNSTLTHVSLINPIHNLLFAILPAPLDFVGEVGSVERLFKDVTTSDVE